MLLITNGNIIKILPILRLERYYVEKGFLIKTSLLNNFLTIFKNHFKYQFKILTYISGSDYPENRYRFQVVYDLLSIKYTFRFRIKTFIDELSPLDSIEKLFLAATWWECEVWDMFGIFFLSQHSLTRILTDYGFQGYPLRKDFPLTGFIESRYNVTKGRVVYEPLELAQEYRTFEYMSPWETFTNK